jgi:hypothetical protein
MRERSAVSDQQSAISGQPSALSFWQECEVNLKDFRKLKVWEKSHCLTVKIYQVTESFSEEELYGLTSQIRRASVSIPAI